MRKLIFALFIVMFAAVSSVYANVFDENSQKYYHQGTNADGNLVYIDKSTINHEENNMTTYVSVLVFSTTSKLFRQAQGLVGPTKVPQFVVSAVTVDCSRARITTGKMAILGIDTNEQNIRVKILWSYTPTDTQWSDIPNGIEPNAKALLCGPSF